MDHFSIHRLEKTWTHYAIDVPSVIGFVCGVILMLGSSHLIKGVIHRHVNATLLRAKLDKTAIDQIFDWPGAGSIGVFERILYIYSVQVLAWPVMAGWLAMKAFFIRIAEPDKLPADHRQTIYHVYLYGNIISVLSGLFCGHIARVISAVIWKVF